jgi:serine/threonine protein kinase
LIGSTVDGKYEVIRLLGKGGMGAVYEVLHTGTNRRLALKVIDAGEAAKHKALVVRLQREARAAGSIASRNILEVVDAGTDPITDAPYLVMELLEGEDLQQALNRVGALPPDVAMKIIAQAAIGLGKAHEARVVHRDIKPANIFLARQRDGEIVVKILDFGIAKLKQDELSQLEGSLTRTGSVLGSPLYMSPEQARGAKTIDHRADLWSLGVVAYQLLTARTPYQEIDALGELILAICSELPPCVQDFAPWVDIPTAATVHRALSLDAGERFQTASSMYDEICSHLDVDPETGKPNLRLDASMIVGVDPGAKSISRPRLIAETGRRPAVTRPPAQSVVTPPPNDHTGDRRQPSAAEIEGGATLLITPAPTPSNPGSSTAVSAGSSAREALAAVAAPPVPQGTAPGLSRSSPAAAPEKARLGFFAGAALAAIVAGSAVAVLMSGVLSPSPPAAASTPPPPATTAAEVAPPKPEPAPPPVASAPAPVEAASATPVSSASTAPSAVATPGKPLGPPKGPVGARPPTAPAPTPPAAPSTVPKANNSGTNGFGDRK